MRTAVGSIACSPSPRVAPPLVITLHHPRTHRAAAAAAMAAAAAAMAGCGAAAAV